MSSVASISHTHPLLEWHSLPNYSLIFTFAFDNSHEIWMSFLPHSVLTLLSWAPASPIWAFMMLSCHQLDLIWSVPSPAWRYCAPLAGMVGWDVALSDLLIKPAIRPNSGLQMSSLVSQVCQTVVEDKFPSFIYWLFLNFHTYALFDVFDIMCIGQRVTA